ncbi:hypothetical protein GCM10009637_24300 [Brevibacterium luteolum]
MRTVAFSMPPAAMTVTIASTMWSLLVLMDPSLSAVTVLTHREYKRIAHLTIRLYCFGYEDLTHPRGSGSRRS